MIDKKLAEAIEVYDDAHLMESLYSIKLDEVEEEGRRLLYLCVKEELLELALENVRKEADELMDAIINDKCF